MENNLPEKVNLPKIDQDLRKLGLKKYLKLQFLHNWPGFLVSLIGIIVVSVGTSYFTSTQVINNVKNEIKNEIISEVKNEINQRFYLGVSTPENSDFSVETINDKEKTTDINSLVDFNENNWVFSDSKYELTDDGFYCVSKVSFPSWFIWTKNKFLIEYEVQIRFKLKDRTNNNKPPTLLLSYGDKTSDVPEIFYTVNVLDGDLKTIRVYAEDDKYKEDDRAKYEPNLDNDLLISLKPSAPSRNLSKISLNPELSFKLENNEKYSFIPEKDFTFGVPLVSISQQGDGKQFGIGISKGDCFKIISSNI